MEAAATACVVLGICGQLAQTENGSGSFMVKLMDALSTLTPAQLEQYKNLEETQYETL
jgi:hydroxyethylthiazole kinase